VAAGRSSGRGWAAWRAEESQRRKARAVTGLEATHRSYQSRRWHRQRGSDGEQLRPAATEKKIARRTVGHRGVLGEGQQREAREAGELGGNVWSDAGAVAGLGGAATAAAAVLSCGRGEQRRKKKGRVCQGLICEL
jgi:hypothetical protein